jgi:hypothetical protein
MLHTLHFSLQNAFYYLMLHFLVPVLFTFYIQGDLNVKLRCQKVKQSSSRTLELAGRGSGERSRKREAQAMRLVTVLWYEMSVKNTSPKYIGR